MKHQPLETVSITELQQDAGAVLDELAASNQPTAVVREQHAAAVLLSVSAWEKAETERRLLRRLAQGEAEIAAGSGHSLDEVLAEADQLLQSRTV